MKTKIPNKIQNTDAVPTADEIIQQHKDMEVKALNEAKVIGRLTIEAAIHTTDLKASYYMQMYDSFVKNGFTKEEAFELTKTLKI